MLTSVPAARGEAAPAADLKRRLSKIHFGETIQMDLHGGRRVAGTFAGLAGDWDGPGSDSTSSASTIPAVVIVEKDKAFLVARDSIATVEHRTKGGSSAVLIVGLLMVVGVAVAIGSAAADAFTFP
ncbi:MAG TPA: hypothetical protein VFQ05_11585 [Candidatus Eisenbacteria bacterium]|nr:hypothetical protein [Candidatus Eisenbacteria bacterium]